mgnify:CR=1 FL=1
MDNPQYLQTHGEGGKHILSFKPYYKWITLNTSEGVYRILFSYGVLNLIING